MTEEHKLADIQNAMKEQDRNEKTHIGALAQAFIDVTKLNPEDVELVRHTVSETETRWFYRRKRSQDDIDNERVK